MALTYIVPIVIRSSVRLVGPLEAAVARQPGLCVRLPWNIQRGASSPAPAWIAPMQITLDKKRRGAGDPEITPDVKTALLDVMMTGAVTNPTLGSSGRQDARILESSLGGPCLAMRGALDAYARNASITITGSFIAALAEQVGDFPSISHLLADLPEHLEDLEGSLRERASADNDARYVVLSGFVPGRDASAHEHARYLARLNHDIACALATVPRSDAILDASARRLQP